MTFSKKINDFRRKITQGLTKNIGRPSAIQKVNLSEKAVIKRILISRPNHRLGNLLLITPLIQEVQATFPDCKIDLFVKGGLAPIVFKNYDNINLIIELPKKPFDNLLKYFKVWITIKKQHYDMVINVDKNSSSGRLSVQFANAKYKFFGDTAEDLQLQYADYEHIAKYPIYNFRNFLKQLGFEKKENPIPSIDIKLSPEEIAGGKKILDDIVTNHKKTISFFTYATADKCYAVDWWTKFYERLQQEYQDQYNLVEVLPVENISQIGFKAPTYYSKDVREIASVIANTELFIGADSGIMHLAAAGLTPTVGLFSRPNIKKYQPFNNNSIGINTNSGDMEQWIESINKILTVGKN